MKKLYFPVLVLMTALCAKDLCAQEEKDLSKYYGVVSKYYPVLDNKDKTDMNNLIYYRFGWNRKAPYTIAIQFANLGYGDRKLKFAVKDVTSKKMIVLDAVHQSRFGVELLKADSTGMIWSGPVANINDGFSLHVWEDGGEEMDKEPVSIKDKK